MDVSVSLVGQSFRLVWNPYQTISGVESRLIEHTIKEVKRCEFLLWFVSPGFPRRWGFVFLEPVVPDQFCEIPAELSECGVLGHGIRHSGQWDSQGSRIAFEYGIVCASPSAKIRTIGFSFSDSG